MSLYSGFRRVHDVAPRLAVVLYALPAVSAQVCQCAVVSYAVDQEQGSPRFRSRSPERK